VAYVDIDVTFGIATAQSVEKSVAFRMTPLFCFTVAVILSASNGGIGPGLAATGASAAVVLAFFQPQVLVLAVAHSSLILFIVLGTGISLAVGHLRTKTAALGMAKQHRCMSL
jgi:hypothetical protein